MPANDNDSTKNNLYKSLLNNLLNNFKLNESDNNCNHNYNLRCNKKRKLNNSIPFNIRCPNSILVTDIEKLQEETSNDELYLQINNAINNNENINENIDKIIQQYILKTNNNLQNKDNKITQPENPDPDPDEDVDVGNICSDVDTETDTDDDYEDEDFGDLKEVDDIYDNIINNNNSYKDYQNFKKLFMADKLKKQTSNGIIHIYVEDCNGKYKDPIEMGLIKGIKRRGGNILDKYNPKNKDDVDEDEFDEEEDDEDDEDYEDGEDGEDDEDGEDGEDDDEDDDDEDEEDGIDEEMYPKNILITNFLNQMTKRGRVEINLFNYFKNMVKGDQEKIINELVLLNECENADKPYHITLLQSVMPIELKNIAFNKIQTLSLLDPSSGEYSKIKAWIDGFMKIPFNIYKKLPMDINQGVEKCHDFLMKSYEVLNNTVYGLDDAKIQIIQLIGQLMTNPNAIGNAVALQGPMGTGKTTLVKEGISKILCRPFMFISLGGSTDSSFLNGHSYTYEGSTWGKIVQFLIDSKCMNPVIYFDELDKISETAHGAEITGILTHLTDTSQNSNFNDKYFTDVKFDLSKCLFIFSYNDETKINPILRDRMYKISTNGYNVKQKQIITNKFIFPSIIKEINFNENDIIIDNNVIKYIIDKYCNDEEGVRNLKRCIEILLTKINLYRLMLPGNNIFKDTMDIDVSFPYTITINTVNKLIKPNTNNPSLYGFYI
jgi:hypothetical protein